MIALKKIFIFWLLTSIATISSAPSKYVIGHWHGGMGICITSVLNHLLYCEYHHYNPVIYWYRSFYRDPKGFNGKKNEWEYYFNPVSSAHYAKGDVINYACGEKEGCGNFNYYHVTQEKRDLAFRLINSYISLNPIVQRKVDRFYNTHLAGKKTVAIHIRGTDKYTEDAPIAPADAIIEALKYADDNTCFFIATDEQRILNEILLLLNGKQVFYYDCYRSQDGKPLHMKGGPKPSFAQLGEDVVVEMWLMARCDILIHTLSNVSSIPLYINPSMEHVLLRA